MTNSFFDDYTPPKIQEKPKATKVYADSKVVDSFSSVPYFDFEKKKEQFISDLKRLSEMSVEEFTFRKKWEEVQEANDSIKGKAYELKGSIWAPTDLNDEKGTIREIEDLRPVVKVMRTPEEDRVWTTLRVYCSSAEFNQAPGRFIKFLMVDENTGKVLGIMSIASDVIAMSDRDSYIGWTLEDKLKYKMLRYSAIGTTIVPTQPLGANFLGGKLTAAMVVSGVVRNEWEKPTDAQESKPCRLVGMTTTSLYGSTKGKLSMYNGLKWWKPVGLSKGKVPIKPYENAYKDWHDWLKENMKDEYDTAMTQKEGVSGPVTGAKMRVLNMIFKAVGVKQSDFVHGFERGVYYSCFYENTREFLCRKITEEQLVMKPLFKDDTHAILTWWKPKAIERYKKLKAEGRLNPNKLFYFEMTGMDYEEAKAKFFSDVGR